KAVRRAAFESDSESDDDDETDRLTKKPKKSLGTKDDVDVSQMLDNIRRRHASGTFTKLVLPAMTWIDVVSKYATTFPWIRGIQGDLRMRKIMEVLPTDPVSIRLHVCRRKLNADVEAITEEFVHLQSVLDGLQAIRPPSHMYHNMHEPLALLPAVRSDDELFQLDMQAPDDHESITFLERMQCTLPGTVASMEVRQVSPTHIIMRTVGHLSRVFRARDGFVSTTELAMLRGIDLTGIQDDQKDAYVWREFIRRANAHFVSWRRRLTALMQEASQHHHDNHLTSK
ncbi:hypothetical protein DYB36_013810, partial [Aphanomyces astaci]